MMMLICCYFDPKSLSLSFFIFRGILLVSEFRKYLKFEFNRPHFEGEEMNFSIPT